MSPVLVSLSSTSVSPAAPAYLWKNKPSFVQQLAFKLQQVNTSIMNFATMGARAQIRKLRANIVGAKRMHKANGTYREKN